MKNSFAMQAANCNNPKWNFIVSRSAPLYKRSQDIRSDFERDYDRIIHTNAYRRLKHKTQVFFFTSKRPYLYKIRTCKYC